MLTERKLGDLIRVKHGFPFLGEHFTDTGEFIVLTPGNFFESGGFKHTPGKEKYYDENFPQEYLCAEGDLIVAMTQQAEGLLGSTALVPESGIYLHNQRIGLISLENKLADKLYIYYLFMTDSVRQQIRSTATGSKVKHTSPERIYDVLAWTPDVPIQESIGKILHTIDRKIALNNAINAELESTARMLYDYWFMQFDFPDVNGKPYKSSGGEMVWNEQLKREIPKGWYADKLNTKLNMERGVEPGSKAYFATQTDKHVMPFIRVSDLGSTPATYISEEAANDVYCVPHNVLVSFDGSIGKIAVAMKGAYSTGIRKITAKDGDYSNALIYFLFQSQEIQKTIKKYAVGSNILHASGSIEHLLFPYGEEIARAYMIKVEPMYRRIISNKLQNHELIILRDFLLPLLMNGQVTMSVANTVTLDAVVEVTEDKQAKRAAVFKRLVLSAYILDNICDEPTAGRVKFEKLLYLSEHCAQLPLNSQFQRAAAGPYDSQALYSIDSQLKSNKWFKRQNKKGESRAYTRMANSKGYEQYLDSNLDAAEKSVIDRLLQLFKTVRTTQCEIVATLYSAWNDFIIDGTQPSDELIVDEVLTNWHESKERIERERWLAALAWMKQKNIVPTGYGIHTKQ